MKRWPVVFACVLLVSCGGAPAAVATSTPAPGTLVTESTRAPTAPPTATAIVSGLASTEVAPFRRMAEAINRGDVAAALEIFSDDVVWERGGQCPAGAGTCVGRAAVQRELARDVAARHQLTLLSADTERASPAIRIELRTDGTRRANVERVIQVFTLDLVGDRISAVRVTFDLTDLVTANFVATQAGTQAR